MKQSAKKRKRLEQQMPFNIDLVPDWLIAKVQKHTKVFEQREQESKRHLTRGKPAPETK